MPILLDKVRGALVPNESAEIIRMLNGAFGGTGPNLHPEDLRPEINHLKARACPGETEMQRESDSAPAPTAH
jgi:glutathionyl-hydroquinone reductase